MLNEVNSNIFKEYKDLVAVFSNKEFGSQSFQNKYISVEKTIKNRNRFFNSCGIDLNKVINVKLNHSNRIYVADENDVGKGAIDASSQIQNYDGLITNTKDLFLMVTGADCFPIYYFDPVSKCIGVAHAGWRGVLSNISEKVVKTMIENYNVTKRNILVYIGPGIRKCHFEVKDDVANLFRKRYEFAISINNKQRLLIDLEAIIEHQLETSGIINKNIERSEVCTFCNNKEYSSYRRDGNKYVEQAAVIGMIDGK